MSDRWTWPLVFGGERHEASAEIEGDRILWSGWYVNLYSAGDPEPDRAVQPVATFVAAGAIAVTRFPVPPDVELAIAERLGARDAWWTKPLGAFETALLEGANRGDLARVRAALAEGANVDARDRGGMTALGYACFHENVEVALALLGRGADVAIAALDGETPLGHAASRHALRIVEALLWHGADPNARTRMGGTALHSAVRVQRGIIADAGDVLRVLVEAGADRGVKDLQGNTALDVARKNGAPDELVALLAPP